MKEGDTMKIMFSGRFSEDTTELRAKLNLYPIQIGADGDGIAFSADLPEEQVKEVVAILDSMESQHFLQIGG